MVGWVISARPDAEQVIKALDMAYEQRGKPQQVLFIQIRAANTPAACFVSGCGDIGWCRA